MVLNFYFWKPVGTLQLLNTAVLNVSSKLINEYLARVSRPLTTDSIVVQLLECEGT